MIMVKCSVCGAENSDDTGFCENCGHPLNQNKQLKNKDKICPQCGAANELTNEFCENCGYNFREVKQTKVESIETNTVLEHKGSTGISRKQHSKTKPKKHWPWFVFGLILVVLIAGGSYFVFTNKRSGELASTTTEKSTSSNNTSDKEAASLAAENSSLKAKQKQSKESSVQTNSSSAIPAITQLSSDKKAELAHDFLVWAGERAELGNMAVSPVYFNHGAAGKGDWFAQTVDGPMQVQDEEIPGANGFDLHALGGVVFYTSKDGTTGYDTTFDTSSTYKGYSDNMDTSKLVSKYVLGDNGVVYQLNLGSGSQVGLETGFSECLNDGTIIKPDHKFSVSKDKAAQSELQKLVKQYQ